MVEKWRPILYIKNKNNIWKLVARHKDTFGMPHYCKYSGQICKKIIFQVGSKHFWILRLSPCLSTHDSLTGTSCDFILKIVLAKNIEKLLCDYVFCCVNNLLQITFYNTLTQHCNDFLSNKKRQSILQSIAVDFEVERFMKEIWYH